MILKSRFSCRRAASAMVGAGFAAALAGPAAALAQEQRSGDDPEVTELAPVTVTGQAPPDIVAAIERLQARDVREIFAEEPSIVIGGGTRNGQRLYMRGIEGTNLNITIDGARQGQNLYNHRGGLNNIDPAILRAVDIQPGPPAADQGHGALGGSIRFETVDARDLLSPGRRFSVRGSTAYAGADDTLRQTLALATALTDQISLLGYGSYHDFDDLRIGGGQKVPFSGGRDRTLLFKLSALDLGAHSLRVAAERNRASGLNFMQRGDYPWQLQPEDFRARPPRRQVLTRDRLTLEYAFAPGSDLLDVEVRLYDRKDDFNAPESNGERFTSDTRGLDVRNTLRYGWTQWRGELTLGVEYFEQDGTAERADRAPRFNSYDNLGVFAQNRLRREALGISFGARYDDFETTFSNRSSANSRTSLNLGADAGLGGGVTVFAGVGESARGAGTIPIHFAANAIPDVAFNGVVGGRLDPERGRMVEAGIAWTATGLFGAADRLDTRLVGYRTRIADPILYDQPGSGGLGGRPVTEFRNAERAARFSGVELRTRYDLERAHVSLSLARMNTADLPPQPQFLARFGAPLGDRTILSLGYDFSPSLQLGYTLTAVRRLTRVPDNQIVFIEKAGYATHDLFLRWLPAWQPAVSVDLAVRNLFDKLYVNHATFTQNGFATEEPGRELRLTLGYRY